MTIPSIPDQIGQKLMLAFKGTQATADILTAIREQRVTGVTLFRHLNLENAAQIRTLTAELQTAARAADLPPLLIAADHETGQLMALGEELTPFSGQMALGAIDDAALTEQVGRAMGIELAALGVNINYAPVADVNTNAHNPNIGIRSFGDRPDLAARHTAALIRGLQAAGVAATAKHFPGLGDAAVDSHYELPTLAHSRDRLENVEFPPFRAAVDAGAKLTMTAHLALPAVSGRDDLPGTVSDAILRGLLRGDMGFEGVIITDAMEMAALAQGNGQIIEAIAAVRASVDLLLLNEKTDIHRDLFHGLAQAVGRGLIDTAALARSTARIHALKQWVAAHPQPKLEVVHSAPHHALAAEVAARSLTLVRDTARRLPLRPTADERILVIVPQTADLTPADTSSYVAHTLPRELRRHHAAVTELIVPADPAPGDIAAVRTAVAEHDLVVLGTISAHLNPAQTDLARAVLKMDTPTVTVALRTPYDLIAYPQARTHVCAYSVHAPAMRALADALFAADQTAAWPGQLPVRLPMPTEV